MRVLHIAPSYNSRSSAAWRILHAQRSLGIDAIGLVHQSGIDDLFVTTGPSFRGKPLYLHGSRLINAALQRLYKNKQVQSPWSNFGWSPTLSKSIASTGPNIVNVHWLPSCINPIDSKHGSHIPYVLTLHDVWPLTGGCHCNYECTNWISGCKVCPQQIPRLRMVHSPEKDWQKKKDLFGQLNNLSIVGPSKWICNMASASTFFVGRKVIHIPNCVDDFIFRVQPKKLCKLDLGIDQDAVVLLFVVSGEMDQFHKGFDLLKTVLTAIAPILGEKVLLLTVGDPLSINQVDISVKVRHLGIIRDETLLAKVYSSSDALLLPSRQDNSPNTVVEAGSCGTPTIGFAVGGVSELIDPQIGGHAIRPFDLEQFVRAIIKLADNTQTEMQRISLSAIFHRRHAPLVCASAYYAIYNELLDSHI